MPSDMSERVYLRVLWAVSSRYKRPNLVAAFSEGLYDAMEEEYAAQVEEAKAWFLGFGHESDGDWTFWETTETLPLPTPVAIASSEAES